MIRSAMQNVSLNYPRLPDILDADTLAAIATLESKEKAFAGAKGRPRHQYLRALYLKVYVALGYGHVEPGGLPRQLRLSIAAQLGVDEALADIRTLERRERNRVLGEVRAFVGLRRAGRADKQQLQAWLARHLARREGDLAVLSNAAIERFRQTGLELPPLSEVTALAERALATANLAIESSICHALNATESDKLLSLIGPGAELLTQLKKPAAAPSTKALSAELGRLELLEALQPRPSVLARIDKRKVQELAAFVKRYEPSEMRQLRASRRQAALVCFVVVRRSELLDEIAEMFVRTWHDIEGHAVAAADEEQRARRDRREHHRTVLRELLQTIQTQRHADGLWQAIHRRSDSYYATILQELRDETTWAASYCAKLEDHYPSLRYFLPQCYASLPLQSTTCDDGLVRAMDFLLQHAKADCRELPVRGAPTSFLSHTWQKRALRRYKKTGQLVRVIKAPYEVGWCDATAAALKSGDLAVSGAHRYAPMTDHLLDRERFVSNFDKHVAKLKLPVTAKAHYSALRQDLGDKLETFNAKYDGMKRQVWMHRDGALSFSKLPGQDSVRRAERISARLAPYMPAVSIIDVLLDCHRWTGFMDAFVPLSGRQSMSEVEKIHCVLAALYAYGCNCGPTEAARALGLSKSQVIYMRRHYLGIRQLIDAASRLSEAYGLTATAGRLGSAGVLLTDAMHVRVPKRSLTGRPYYRDFSHKNVLLYQHITSHCICQFTQALLCNVSEAIHMLHGVMMCRQGQDPMICVCDSGGKSDLIFGLASLLNIRLYPRVRSRNLKLWSPRKGLRCDNLPGSFAGVIRWDWLDEGWQDMMLVLASIASGTASPAVIAERLAQQPNHPATRGFQELGKLERSRYLLDYGMDMDLRHFVVPYTARREHWNKFTRDVLAFGDLVHEKCHEGQEEVFWFLSVVQNAIILWNALALEKAIEAARRDGIELTEEDLEHVLPTMLAHISFIGRFDLNLHRRPPFRLAAQM